MRHPREGRLDRRDFLKRSAGAAVGLSSLGALLAACGGGSGGAAGGGTAAAGGSGSPTTGGMTDVENAASAGTEGGIPLARPDAPVTLPIFDDNPPIESGLEPEAGPLRIYNWVDYIWKKKLADFGKEYGVEVEYTTFYTMDEAVQKLTSGQAEYDVFWPTPDRISRLVYGKILQPLNHDYLPNLKANVWPSMQDPFYDKGSLYTVPYTIYTTGIGYRRDRVKPEPSGYEIFWDPTYKGETFLLDDSREAIGMVLLKNGIADVNTGDPAVIEQAKQELLELIDLVNVKVSVEDYIKIPEGSATVHQAWSGDMVGAQWYLPEGTGVDVLGYWYPPGGGGVIGNDAMAITKNAKNPVLAHHFLNFMLDEKNGYENFTQYNGYQPPFVSIDPDRLVSEGVVPETLSTAVVRETDFQTGYLLLELDPEAFVTWQNAWAEFKAGA